MAVGPPWPAASPSARSLVVIALAYLLNLAGWPAYFDDEGTYVSQAWAVQEMGALAPYTYWFDHRPSAG